MSSFRPPLEDPPRGDRSRQKFMLKAAVAIFVLTGIVVLVLPLPLPRPVRLAVAATDFLAAAIIWLLARQKFR